MYTLDKVNLPFIPEINLAVTFSDKVKKRDLVTVNHSSDIAKVMRDCYNKNTIDWIEEFLVFCLNRSNKIVGFYRVSKGGVTGTVADPRVILTVALQCCATAIILTHNHPSGGLRPSKSDEDLTFKIKEAARYFDIAVLDHIIVGDEDSYYSFADEGIL
jgi:DNA repair protein RadC